jgi:hypothetical protein
MGNPTQREFGQVLKDIKKTGERWQEIKRKDGGS